MYIEFTRSLIVLFEASLLSLPLGSKN